MCAVSCNRIGCQPRTEVQRVSGRPAAPVLAVPDAALSLSLRRSAHPVIHLTRCHRWARPAFQRAAVRPLNAVQQYGRAERGSGGATWDAMARGTRHDIFARYPASHSALVLAPNPNFAYSYPWHPRCPRKTNENNLTRPRACSGCSGYRTPAALRITEIIPTARHNMARPRQNMGLGEATQASAGRSSRRRTDPATAALCARPGACRRLS